MKRTLWAILGIELLAFVTILYYIYYYLPHRNCPPGGCYGYVSNPPVHEVALIIIPVILIVVTGVITIVYKKKS
jgi:heme/copper-type cytochrome/quinol oxidase subunit 2